MACLSALWDVASLSLFHFRSALRHCLLISLVWAFNQCRAFGFWCFILKGAILSRIKVLFLLKLVTSSSTESWNGDWVAMQGEEAMKAFWKREAEFALKTREREVNGGLGAGYGSNVWNATILWSDRAKSVTWTLFNEKPNESIRSSVWPFKWVGPETDVLVHQAALLYMDLMARQGLLP